MGVNSFHLCLFITTYIASIHCIHETNPKDWRSGKTALECTKYMLDNEVNCDVNFKVGENEEIMKAHKFILSMRSPVFNRMFNRPSRESEKDPVIPDVTSVAFRMLLRYCYYECLDIDDDIALSTLYASTKYVLPLLENAARKKLIQIMVTSNVWDMYTYAIRAGDTELHAACRMYFQGDVTPVRAALQAEAFLNIQHEVLLDFLHINDKADNVPSLNGNPENTDKSEDDVDYENHFGISTSDIELFKACNAWAVAECVRQQTEPTGANKRTVLAKVLFLIRFPTMLQKDLMTIVYPTAILRHEEMVTLGQCIQRDPGSECRVDFPINQRQFLVTQYCWRSTVNIESEVRVMLSRVWILWPGSYRVTVSDEGSQRSQSMVLDTKHENHVSGSYILHYMDIEPQVLEAGTKYAITAVTPKTAKFLNRQQGVQYTKIPRYLNPFLEVKITQGPETFTHIDTFTTIYGFTLSLI